MSVSFLGSVIINGYSGCSFLAAYRVQAGQWLKSVGSLQSSAAVWRCSAFMAWTRWTHTVILHESWCQHHKHCSGIIIFIIFYYFHLFIYLLLLLFLIIISIIIIIVTVNRGTETCTRNLRKFLEPVVLSCARFFWYKKHVWICTRVTPINTRLIL